MAISLNHTIVLARDKQVSASFLTTLFDLPDAVPVGPFLAVRLHNDVTLDFADPPVEVLPQHYAFQVTEEEFDAIYGRILERGLEHWADPHNTRPGEINRNNGGRGVYFRDPAGHNLEILTRP
ncbi:VOC family protein [Rhodococcus xishaensis]|uniref:VOC family protein n=1 Tax=Rhodococcus xishaensis TaxID=2487364 RepID=A0A438B3X8_9NOCA|nr:VOC family protein [Rhodococcus xishaensis]RVW05694.1 VOC family protein [Rhodococcus xishaensis]